MINSIQVDKTNGNHEKYRMICEMYGLGYWEIDLVTEELIMSEVLWRLLGYTENISKNIDINEFFSRHIHPEFRSKLGQIIERLKKNPETLTENSIELKLIAVNGDEKWVHSYMVIEDAQNLLKHRIIGTIKEITDIKKAQIEIEDKLAFIESLIDTIPNPVFYKDADFIYRYCNEAFVKYLARENKSEIIGKSVYEIAPEELADVYHEADIALANSEGVQVYESKVMSATGKEKYVIFYKAAVKSKNNRLIGLIGTINDITERVNHEMQLETYAKEIREAQIKAEEASRAKSIFLANMSHELRTPMNAILGYSELMLTNSDIKSHKECEQNLKTIHGSGEHLLSLINNILELSKIEAEKTTLYIKTFNLKRMLAEIEMMFRLQMAEKNLWFSMEYLCDIPQCIETDQGKLKQIIINLLSNAVKYTCEGGVILNVSVVKSELSIQHRLIIEVTDTGEGIAPEELNWLFKDFTQTETGMKSGGGTGLGLAISRAYARLMGGDIEVVSQVGKGSTFRLEIDCIEGLEEDLEEIIEQRRVIGLADAQEPLRVLVVDDIVFGRKLLVEYMERIGMHVYEATNGQEAIEKYKEIHPHIIWMDIRMPVMDGIEATRVIRKISRPDEVKIIAVSASVWDRSTVFEAGCDDFILKPFQGENIYNMLGKYCNVQFVYETYGDFEFKHTIMTKETLKECLSKLDKSLYIELYNAVLKLNTEIVFKTINRIEEFDKDLADSLMGMALSMNYDKILEILE